MIDLYTQGYEDLFFVFMFFNLNIYPTSFISSDSLEGAFVPLATSFY